MVAAARVRAPRAHKQDARRQFPLAPPREPTLNAARSGYLIFEPGEVVPIAQKRPSMSK